MMDQNMGIAAPQSQPSPSGVQSFVSPLSQMPIEALLQEFNNPASQFPKFAVLTAMQKKQEQARMQQAMQGQMAMAQNAQQQQQPPIAQGILAGAQQMAAQEQMPVYNMGGVVALANGGLSSEFGLSDVVATAVDEERARQERERQQLKDREAQLSQQIESLKMQRDFESTREEAAQIDKKINELENIRGGLVSYPTKQTPQELERYLGPAITAPAPAPASVVTRAPSTGIARPPAAPAVDPMAEYRKLIDAAIKSEQASARLTPEEDQARKARLAMMQANLGVSQKEAQDVLAAAEARRQGIIGQAKRSILEDPEALLRMAGAIRTGRGEGIGSLAAAAGAELGRRREAIQAAEERFAGEQKEVRALNAANRAVDLSRMELQEAYASRDADRIRTAEKNASEARLGLEKARLEYDLKAREVATKEMAARAQMISAGKPTAQDAWNKVYEAKLQELTGGKPPTAAQKLDAMQFASQVAGGKVGTERLKLDRLRALQKSLKDETENYSLPKERRDLASKRLSAVNEEILREEGLGDITGAAAAPGTVLKFDSQGNLITK